MPLFRVKLLSNALLFLPLNALQLLDLSLQLGILRFLQLQHGLHLQQSLLLQTVLFLHIIQLLLTQERQLFSRLNRISGFLDRLVNSLFVTTHLFVSHLRANSGLQIIASLFEGFKLVQQRSGCGHALVQALIDRLLLLHQRRHAAIAKLLLLLVLC